MKPTKKYIVRDREAGNWISEHILLSDAKEALRIYELEDKKEGAFTENFYEIAERDENGSYISLQ